MKANTFRSRKSKGTKLEHRVAQLIRESGLDEDAKRMIGSGAFSGWKTDIFTKLPYSFEIKNQEKTKPWEWFKQAEGQATIAKPPVVVFSGNYKPIMALITFNLFLNLLRTIQDLEGIIEKGKT